MNETLPKIQTLNLPVRFPGLNEHDGANRTNKYAGAKMKHEYTEVVNRLASVRLKPVTVPVELEFLWIEPNARRDPDNVVFAKKYILDGLVAAGILPDDTMKWIFGWSERWLVKPSPKSKIQMVPDLEVGVIVTIKEIV